MSLSVSHSLFVDSNTGIQLCLGMDMMVAYMTCIIPHVVRSVELSRYSLALPTNEYKSII